MSYMHPSDYPPPENGTPVVASVYEILGRALADAIKTRPETFKLLPWQNGLYDTRTKLRWCFERAEFESGNLELDSPERFKINNKYWPDDVKLYVHRAWQGWYRDNVTNAEDNATLKRANKALDRQLNYKNKWLCPRFFEWLYEVWFT